MGSEKNCGRHIIKASLDPASNPSVGVRVPSRYVPITQASYQSFPEAIQLGLTSSLTDVSIYRCGRERERDHHEWNKKSLPWLSVSTLELRSHQLVGGGIRGNREEAMCSSLLCRRFMFFYNHCMFNLAESDAWNLLTLWYINLLVSLYNLQFLFGFQWVPLQ